MNTLAYSVDKANAIINTLLFLQTGTSDQDRAALEHTITDLLHIASDQMAEITSLIERKPNLTVIK